MKTVRLTALIGGFLVYSYAAYLYTVACEQRSVPPPLVLLTHFVQAMTSWEKLARLCVSGSTKYAPRYHGPSRVDELDHDERFRCPEAPRDEQRHEPEALAWNPLVDTR